MASGVPVVASRISGIPELVEDGVSGLLVPPGDAQSLAKRARPASGRPLAARSGSLAPAARRSRPSSTFARARPSSSVSSPVREWRHETANRLLVCRQCRHGHVRRVSASGPRACAASSTASLLGRHHALADADRRRPQRGGGHRREAREHRLARLPGRSPRGHRRLGRMRRRHGRDRPDLHRTRGPPSVAPSCRQGRRAQRRDCRGTRRDTGVLGCEQRLRPRRPPRARAPLRRSERRRSRRRPALRRGSRASTRLDPASKGTGTSTGR